MRSLRAFWEKTRRMKTRLACCAFRSMMTTTTTTMARFLTKAQMPLQPMQIRPTPAAVPPEYQPPMLPAVRRKKQKRRG